MRLCTMLAMSLLACASPRPPGHGAAHSMDGPSQSFVTELPIGAPGAVINDEAMLVAGITTDQTYVTFDVLTLSNDLIEHRFARRDDLAATARLQTAVNRYLSHGRWRRMIDGSKRTAADGALTWQVGDLTAAENDARITLFKDGEQVGVGPPGAHRHFPDEERCTDAIKVALSSLSVDPKSHWVWAAYQPEPHATPCVAKYVQVFLAWHGTSYQYSSDLEGIHPDM